MKTLQKQGLKLFSFLLIAVMFVTACGSTSSSSSNSNTDTSTVASTTASTTASTAAKVTPKPVTIEFWHAYGEGEEKVLLSDVIPAFEKKYPNIKVKATRMPTDGLEQQVITAAAGGTAPDLMRMDIIWVSKFAKLGALQPLDGFNGFKSVVDNSFAGPMSTNYYKGKYYGVPLDTNTKVAIYNKELLKLAGASEPPKTIDELVSLAKNLKTKGKYYGITIGGPDSWNMPPFFWTLGGKITDDQFTKASGYMNSPESVKALQTIVDWKKQGLLAPPILGGQPGTWEGLRGDKGKPASYMMINDGPWFYGILGDSVKGSMIPAKMPAGPDGKSHSIVGGQDLVMFQEAKHPKEAWTFAQFLLSEDMQVLMAKKTGSIPTNKTAAKSDKLNSIYYYQPFADELETAYPRTPSPEWDKISDAFQTAFESALRGKATPQAALDKAAKQIDELLQAK